MRGPVSSGGAVGGGACGRLLGEGILDGLGRGLELQVAIGGGAASPATRRIVAAIKKANCVIRDSFLAILHPSRRKTGRLGHGETWRQREES